MSIKKIIVASLMAVAAFATATNSNLKLVPGTISNGAVARWIVQGDSTPANHVLLLAKNVPTTANEAAGADIQRIAGTPMAQLTGLRWTLISGTPGGGAPRWNVYYGPANGGISGYEFLEPTSYDAHNVGRVTAAQIQNPLYFVGAAPQPGDVVKYLQIIVDVQKSVTLDDIGVTIGTDETVFSGPGNSN